MSFSAIEVSRCKRKLWNLLTRMPDGQILELSSQDGHCLLRCLATSSPEVQQQVLHLLDKKMPVEQVTAVFALSDCHLHKQALYFLEETKPKEWFTELSIEHRERLCSLLASTDCLVQQRALTLLETRMANELSFVLAEDWKKAACTSRQSGLEGPTANARSFSEAGVAQADVRTLSGSLVVLFETSSFQWT